VAGISTCAAGRFGFFFRADDVSSGNLEFLEAVGADDVVPGSESERQFVDLLLAFLRSLFPRLDGIRMTGFGRFEFTHRLIILCLSFSLRINGRLGGWFGRCGRSIWINR